MDKKFILTIKLPRFSWINHLPPSKETIHTSKCPLLMAVQNGLNLFVTFLLYDDLRQAINIFRQHRNRDLDELHGPSETEN